MVIDYGKMSEKERNREIDLVECRIKDVEKVMNNAQRRLGQENLNEIQKEDLRNKLQGWKEALEHYHNMIEQIKSGATVML